MSIAAGIEASRDAERTRSAVHRFTWSPDEEERVLVSWLLLTCKKYIGEANEKLHLKVTNYSLYDRDIKKIVVLTIKEIRKHLIFVIDPMADQ